MLKGSRLLAVLQLWEDLGLRKFWQQRLGRSREGTDSEHVARRLIDLPYVKSFLPPGSLLGFW